MSDSLFIAPIHIAVISGSTRKQRLSHRAALFLKEHLSAKNYFISLIDLSEFQLPVFEETIDKIDTPNETVLHLYQTLKAADAFVFVSPEYNGSYTAALKNMVDHLPTSTFYRKPIGVVSVTTGSLGGMRGAVQMQNLVTALSGYPLPQMLLVSQVNKKFDDEGRLLDLSFERNIELFIDELLWLTQSLAHTKSCSVTG